MTSYPRDDMTKEELASYRRRMLAWEEGSWGKGKDELKKAQAKRRAETGVERLALKQSLEEENGVVGHPKSDYLFLQAWSRGHALGDTEVKMCYNEMVWLIKE